MIISLWGPVLSLIVYTRNLMKGFDSFDEEEGKKDLPGLIFFSCFAISALVTITAGFKRGYPGHFYFFMGS